MRSLSKDHRRFSGPLSADMVSDNIDDTYKIQQDLEKKSVITCITKSGWLFLFGEVLVSLLSKKISFEHQNEFSVAQKGLLVRDTKRSFLHFWSLNLLIGIVVGLIADCLIGKKCIMLSVMFANIVFHFYIAMTEVWHSDEIALSWKVQLYLQLALHSMQGVAIAAMYESLATEEYEVLFFYATLKLVASSTGEFLYLVFFVVTVNQERVVLNFGCFFTSTVIFFIWLLIDSLKLPQMRVGFFKVLYYVGFLMLSRMKVKQAKVQMMKNRTGKPVYNREHRDRLDVSAKLLRFMLILIPVMAASFMTQSTTMFRDIFKRLSALQWKYVDITEIVPNVTLVISIPFIELVLFPCLQRIFRRLQVTFTLRLIVSMFMGCAIYIYGIFIMKAILLEEPGIPTTWTYEVRFVNALDKDITLKPVDSIHHSAVVEANSVKVMTYVRPYFGAPIKSILQIQLKSSYDYVIGISIEQESCVTYIITDFMEIRRVPGVDPIFEGPPGTNDPTMTRVYFANFDTELAMRLVLTYHRSKVVSDGRVDQSEMEIVVLAGKRHVFCIFPGFYFVRIKHTSFIRIYEFGAGGVYGIIYLPNVKETTSSTSIFQIVPPTSLSMIHGIIMEIFIWFSFAFVVIIIEVFVFLKSPYSLRSFTFSVYYFFVNVSSVEMTNIVSEYLGQQHGGVRSGLFSLVLSGSFYLVLCFVSGFIMIKNKKYFILKTHSRHYATS